MRLSVDVLRKLFSYLLLALSLLASSCREEGRVIPRKEMSRIYADMFLADKQLMKDPQLRRVADTTRVYEAIFEKYGYTVEDYYASQEEYILDARRYVKMVKKSVEILEKENKVLKEEKARIDALLLAKEGVLRFAPNRIYKLDTIACADSLLFFDFQKGYDTVFSGPRLVVASDTVSLDIVEIRDSTSTDSTFRVPVKPQRLKLNDSLQ